MRAAPAGVIKAPPTSTRPESSLQAIFRSQVAAVSQTALYTEQRSCSCLAVRVGHNVKKRSSYQP